MALSSKVFVFGQQDMRWTRQKISKFDNFYAFSRPKFEFLSQNLDILPKNCNFKSPKSILSSTNFYWFFADFWPKNQ